MSSRKVVLFISIMSAAALLSAYLILSLTDNIYCQSEQIPNIFSLGSKVKIPKTEFPFKPGEFIEYDVRMNFFTIGKANLTYQGKALKKDIETIGITFFTKAVNFSDLENIYADAETFNPLWVARKIDFLNRSELINEDYAKKANSVTITKYKNDKAASVREITSDASFQHAISGIYYCRKLKDLGVGSKFSLNLPLSKLRLEVKRIESVKVPYGKFKAFYIESVPNKYRFWLSADEKRLPLKVEGAISISAASLVMTKYKESF